MIAAHKVLNPTAGRQVSSGFCALAVMTKVPRAGQVKTRLSPPLTPTEAAELNICFLRDTAASISLAVEEGRARGIAAYTPAGEESAYAEILPGHFEMVRQRGGAFGERLLRATEDLLLVGFDSVCLIDSDSPTVSPDAYAEAARLLSETGDRIVLGPSDDGGYYLIGMKQLHPRLFEDIDWSTERVCAQTIKRAGEIGVEVKRLPVSFDVDDRATLRRLCDELLGGETIPGAYEAPATRQFLADLIAREGRVRIWPNETIDDDEQK